MIAHSNSGHRLDIDGLRALAIIPVVLFHAIPGAAPGGFIGVDIFFVISGFLITGIIKKEVEANDFSFARFYLRRARRIFPAYVTVIGVVSVAAALILLPSALKLYGESLASASTFLANFYFWKHSSYFDASLQSAPLLHL